MCCLCCIHDYTKCTCVCIQNRLHNKTQVFICTGPYQTVSFINLNFNRISSKQLKSVSRHKQTLNYAH